MSRPKTNLTQLKPTLATSVPNLQSQEIVTPASSVNIHVNSDALPIQKQMAAEYEYYQIYGR